MKIFWRAVCQRDRGCKKFYQPHGICFKVNRLLDTNN